MNAKPNNVYSLGTNFLKRNQNEQNQLMMFFKFILL